MEQNQNESKSIWRELWESIVIKLLGLLAILSGMAQLISFFFPEIPNSLREVSLKLTIFLAMGALAWVFGIAIRRVISENKQLKMQVESLLRERRFLSLAQLGTVEDFERLTTKAKSIFVYGITLSALVSRHRLSLEKLKKEGCNFRILLPNLDSLVDTIYLISLDWSSPRSLIDEHHSCMQWLTNFAIIDGGNLTVKESEVLPTITLILINPDSDDGYARVSVHIYKGTFETRPFLEISQKENPEWYNLFYTRYYLELWNKSKEFRLGLDQERERARERLQKRLVAARKRLESREEGG